jgi:hypothetical protein
MSNILSISFITSNGSKASLSIADVRENITKEEIESLMNLIIEKDYFETKNGSLIAINAAKIVKKEENKVI